MKLSRCFPLVYVLAVVLCLLTVGAATASRYTVGPAISGSIYLTDGQKWAHKDDNAEWCNVAVYDTIDKDCEVGVGLVENYYEEAAFNGGVKGYCTPAVHATTTKWYATGTGSSVVTATLKDYATSPAASANDTDVTITLGQNPVSQDFCAGFTVLVEFNINGDFAMTDIQCAEGDTWSAWQHGWWSDWVSVYGSSDTITKDSTDKFLTITTTFKTVPTDALPRKNIKAKLRYKPTASWEYEFSDADLNDGEDSFSVSLSFILGIGYSWDLRDNDEGGYAGVWTYATDLVGAPRQPGSPDFSDCTSNYSEIDLPHSDGNSCTGDDMERNTGEGYASHPNGDSSVSTFVISAGVSAVGDDEDNWSKARIKFDDSYFYIDEVTY